tara:strand:- start:369 stop:1136 length:768 start_codon:yes stop_codon:yes gene_type:complete
VNEQNPPTPEQSTGPVMPVTDKTLVRLTPTQMRQWRWASTRLLVLLWCAYLFGIWILSLQADSPSHASHWMIWCMMIGMLIIWPALTLSQTRYIIRPHHDGPNPEGLPGMPIPVPMRTWVVFIQWLCLGLVNQSVLWPMQITANWQVMQTMWINAALLAWSLLIGLFIAVGKRSFSTVHRSIAMLICVGLIFGEPLLQGITGISWHMLISPLHTVHQLLSGHITTTATSHITAVALAACVGWGILGIIQAARVES